MGHLVFVDSSTTGLAAFETARRLGDEVTFVRPRDLLFADLFGLAPAKLAAALVAVDRCIEIESLTGSFLLEALSALHAEHPIDALITVSELAVLPVADAAAALGVRFSDPQALRIAVFKDRCRAHLALHGFRTARYGAVRDLDAALRAARDIGYPVIVKPTRGVGKQLSGFCFDDDDVRAFFASEAETRAALHPAFRRFMSEEFVVEERLLGPLYSAEVAVADGVFLPLVVTGRTQARHDALVEIGAFMPSDLPQDETREALDYVERVLASIGLAVGLFHVEVIMTPEGPALVEINPRMMGGTLPQMYGHVAEIDPFEVLIAVHAGRALDAARLIPRRAAVSLAVGALEEGVAPHDVETRLDRLFGSYELFENTIRIAPGQRLPKFTGNFSALGRLGIAAPDHDTAMALGRRFIVDLETALGCPMAIY
ncbi:MAG: ATP-grasp domain-containing protein [Microvirga sp.]|nr:ATP-grasp domain-containing protein [Microvirga sp.]